MRSLTKEGKSILFISHKLNEIMAVADRVTVLRKGRYVGTVNTCDTNKQELSNMMVGRPVQLQVVKEPAQPKDPVLRVRHMCVASHQHKRDAVHDVSLEVRAGEIVCIAGIDGNGQTEFVQGLTGLDKITGGTVELCGKNITHTSIRRRGENMSHIPEDRHKHGLILDFTLEQNMVLQRYLEPQFQKAGFIKNAAVREYAQHLIEQYDVRSGQGPVTIARSMSGGNQQKAIIAREVDRDKSLIVAVQPTRGLDVGAIEYIHSQLVAERDRGKAVLLVSLELDEVMSLSDRILVMYEAPSGTIWEVTRHEKERTGSALRKRRHQKGALIPDLHCGGSFSGRHRRSDRGPVQREDLPERRMGRHPHHLRRYLQHRPRRRRYPDLGLQRREPGQHAVPGHAPDYDGPFRGRGLQDGPVQHRRARPVSGLHHGHPDGGPVHSLQRGARGRYLGAGLPGRVPVRRSVGRDSRPGEGPAEH